MFYTLRTMMASDLEMSKEETSILSLLAVSMFVPIFLLSRSLKYLTSDVSTEFIEDLSSIKYRTEVLKLNAIEQEDGDGLKQPTLVVYKDKNFDSFVSFSSDGNIKFEQSTNKGGNANVSERNGNCHCSDKVGLPQTYI